MPNWIRLLLCAAPGGSAWAQGPISCTVRMANPDSHYAQVEMRVPPAGRAAVDLKMSVWTAM